MGGVLQDGDRIFTNLYGLHDPGLAAARRRGAWNGAVEMLAQGPEWIATQVRASGLRGRGGAGVLTAMKWSLMAAAGRAAALHLAVNADESEPGTCKDREILRNDPHLLIEGLSDRRPRDRRARGLHLHPRRVRRRARAPRRRHRRGPRGAADRAGQPPRLGPRGPRRPRRRGLRLRRGDRAAGEPGRQEGLSARAAALSSLLRPLWLPDRGQQRRDHRRARGDPAPRRRLVRRHRPAGQRRNQALQHLRPCECADQCRGRRCRSP